MDKISGRVIHCLQHTVGDYFNPIQLLMSQSEKIKAIWNMVRPKSIPRICTQPYIVVIADIAINRDK